MLNKIFISHWKITLIVSTLGFIALAIIAVLYWIPPVSRVVEIPITLEELTKTSLAHPSEKPDNMEKIQPTPVVER